MSETPPRRISINRPPPSPPSYIRITSRDSFTQIVPAIPRPRASPIVTPKRKARKDVKARAKRQKLQERELSPFEEVVVGIDDDTLLFQAGDTRETDADSVGDDEEYRRFVESVLADECSMYQLSDSLFVVSGWNQRLNMGTASWYHFQMTNVGIELIAVCLCPQAGGDGTGCFHARFVREYQAEKFPRSDMFAMQRDDLPILFSREQDFNGNENSINHFSAPTPGQRSLKSRAVVTFKGNDSGNGSWVCDREAVQNCAHINACRHALQKYVHVDIEAMDSGKTSNVVSAPRARQAKREEVAVSYLTIPPPHWASINGDPDFGPPKTPLREPPALIRLTETSTCCCATPRCQYIPSAPIRQDPCIIYGITHSFPSVVETQACRLCNHRFIGPDCQELGIFNFNNQVMFTHEILDDYTSNYTTSETPFAAWVAILARRYTIHETGGAFVSEKMFRSIWFAYVKLQYLGNDMICPRCGPCPETTIWDGVTLAFNRKHLLPTLEPPTTLHERAISRDKTRYHPGQQLIPDSNLRKVVQRIITRKTPALSTRASEEEDECDGDEVEGEGEISEKATQETLEWAGLIHGACEKLTEVNRGLGNIFVTHFGVRPLLDGIVPNDVYRRLLLQIAAEESVLQMAIRSALDLLDVFTENPTTTNASALINIPALRDVLTYEFKLNQRASDSIIDVCKWIVQRGRSVLAKLLVYPAPEHDNVILGNGTHWEKTGCCYGMPQIRLRPKYPGLKHDVRGDVNGKRGAKCSKFYSKYGEKRLTGGIMCVWCTHSICYGFHCIPRGEGRNDVFSAIITRWPKPPKRVIYDFACALGPYCMTREPEFFADTLFLIDDFHSKDHTKCSEAAFLKTYCNVDPRLSVINSSAGECGNSGIARIRKSVSYMSQDRAVLYTRVFMSAWNRLRIRKIE
ncbi:hypothetical protein BD779DRAFT_1456051 [Infundibulicybe gibba]|nr:hypothetical protein BD779DRAFT_1456051 [Infundibulicybe gibba]